MNSIYIHGNLQPALLHLLNDFTCMSNLLTFLVFVNIHCNSQSTNETLKLYSFWMHKDEYRVRHVKVC